jgi:hypothetical protein
MKLKLNFNFQSQNKYTKHNILVLSPLYLNVMILVMNSIVNQQNEIICLNLNYKLFNTVVMCVGEKWEERKNKAQMMMKFDR